MATQPLVRGQVRFEPGAPPVVNATVRLQLEDVSLADAPARVVAQQVIRDVSVRTPAATPIPFLLHGPVGLDPRPTYNLRVHVDLNGNGQIEVGDFITMRRVPVSLRSRPGVADVLVRRVG
jgi:uncharacterized lipoprotein YbaY